MKAFLIRLNLVDFVHVGRKRLIQFNYSTQYIHSIIANQLIDSRYCSSAN